MTYTRMSSIFTILSVIALAAEMVSCCSSGGGISIPRSNSGRPFGVDISDNAEIYPTYDGSTQSVGVGLEIRFRRRRSPVSSASLDEGRASRMLFSVFDFNGDGKLDVQDWSREGGKLAAFTNLILDHDMDGDEKLSLDEFLQVRILPDFGLGLGLDRDRLSDANNNEGTPSPAQD